MEDRNNGFTMVIHVSWFKSYANHVDLQCGVDFANELERGLEDKKSMLLRVLILHLQIEFILLPLHLMVQ